MNFGGLLNASSERLSYLFPPAEISTARVLHFGAIDGAREWCTSHGSSEYRRVPSSDSNLNLILEGDLPVADIVVSETTRGLPSDIYGCMHRLSNGASRIVSITGTKPDIPGLDEEFCGGQFIHTDQQMVAHLSPAGVEFLMRGFGFLPHAAPLIEADTFAYRFVRSSASLGDLASAISTGDMKDVVMWKSSL